MIKKNILIYSDDGASQDCVNALLKYYGDQAQLTSGVDLQSDDWIQQTKLLIVPGGRSLPFYKTLSKVGNQNIIQFVEQGGCYLGLCAGAYYASSETIFATSTPLELNLQSELNFFLGRAIGPVFSDKKFEYNSESGAEQVDIIWQDQKKYSVYFNGGCYFENADQFSNTKILAWYTKNNLPAIIICKVGKGCALLSGVHPELSFDQTLSKILLDDILI